jgi:hypothetical protein
MRARWLALGALALAASGCGNGVDQCNTNTPPNLHLTLVDATTQAPVRGFAHVGASAYSGADDCFDCGGCASVNVLVKGPQTVRVSADGYAAVTLQVDGGSGHGACGHTFEDISQVVQLSPQPGATGTPSGIVCGDMSMRADM